MKGQSLWREVTSPSLCAFCAHRLTSTRPLSRVQRRSLYISKSAARPSSHAAEARSAGHDDSHGWTTAFAESYAGRPDSSPDLNDQRPKWVRPAFGNKANPGSDRLGEQSKGTAVEHGSQELTAEDRRVRDAIQAQQRKMEEEHVEGQKRHVAIPSGPGPQATRSGRHMPKAATDNSVRSNGARERAMILEQARKKSVPSSLGGSPQYMGGSSRAARGSGADQDVGVDGTQRKGAWSQLPRRVKSQSPRDHNETSPRESERSRNEIATSKSDARLEPQRHRGFTSIHRVPYRGSFHDRDQLQNNTNAPRTDRQSLGSNIKPYDSMDDVTRTPGRGLAASKAHTRDAENQVQGNDLNSRVAFRPIISRSSNTSGATDSYRDSMSQSGQSRGRAIGSPVERGSVRNVDAIDDIVGTRDRGQKQVAETKEAKSFTSLPKGKERDKAKRRERFVLELEDSKDEEEQSRKAELKRQKKAEKARKKLNTPVPIILPEYISVSNLATALRIRFNDFVEKLGELGFEEISPEFILNSENAGLIAQEYDFEPIVDRSESEDLRARPAAKDMAILPSRPPVVTIMGHVDHGKTTLLDWLRKSSVAATEHGGITQHIGAFSVPMPSGKTITFLDTPGHAAFLSMRQRGANVTDIVILVVAADDSVKPQTIEAINHAKAAEVPIIVAINKIDKEDSNVERVKQDLARHGVDVEDFGGDTQVVCVSGKTGQGMMELEDSIVTLSEILDMKAETDGPVEGWVLEASIKSMGKVATVLIRRGTLRPGDFVVAGKTWARIRCLRNEAGVEIESAGPGTPVEIDNWDEQPLAGDEVLQAPSQSKAVSVVEYRLAKEGRDKLAEDMEAINVDRKAWQERRDIEKTSNGVATDEDRGASSEAIGQSGPKQVNFLVKGDVSGSVEAVIDSISAIGNQEVQAHVIRSGVGQISEFDVEHAAAAQGLLINFNTIIDPAIRTRAAAAKVKILDHNIIYRLVDDVKSTLSELLPPLITYRVLGEAEVAQVFDITIKGRRQKPVPGCRVRNGVVTRNGKTRVLRGGVKIFDGQLESLKNVKKDVTEMRKGTECGLSFDGWSDFKIGDQIQTYETIEEKRHL